MKLKALGVAISILSIAAVTIWALDQETPTLPPGNGKWFLLGGGLALYALATLLRSERWRLLLIGQGWNPARAECYGLTVVGFAGNSVLPLRGGDALRILYMARHTGHRLRDSTSVLIAERGLDALTLLTIYAILAYGLLSGIEVPELSDFATTALGVIAVAVVVATVFAVARKLGRSGPLRELIKSLGSTVAQMRSAHGARMLGLTVVIWSAEAANLALIGDAVGLEMNPLEALYLVGLGGIFLMIPSGPGFAGTFDAAILFGAASIGADGETALSFLLASRLVIFAPITIAGGLTFALRYRNGVPLRSGSPSEFG